MSRSTEEIVKDHVRYMTSDVENWLGLLAEDVVFEFPFGQSVGAATVKGKQAAGDAVRGFLGLFERLDLSLITVYRLRDGSEAFAEFEGSGRVRSNGNEYRQKYLAYIRCEGGKIVHIKEYFDPHAVKSALALS